MNKTRLNSISTPAIRYSPLVILIIFISIADVHSLFAKPVFDQANAKYKNKQYGAAAGLYREAIKKGDHNAPVYYNLANCYYQLKQFPAAVLYYEKALKHDPGNNKIEHNLKLAQNKALSKIETTHEFFVIRFTGDFVREFGARVWSIVFLAVLWLSVLAFIVYFNKAPGSGTAYLRIGISGFLLSAVLFLIAKNRYEQQTTYTHAIVMQENAELKTEPVKAAKTAVFIEAGNKVELLDRDAEWYKVALPNGKTGWINKEDLAKI